jgi:hypothetical protein
MVRSSLTQSLPDAELQKLAGHERYSNRKTLLHALRLDKAVALGGVEPFHGTCKHFKLLQSSIAAAGV